MQKRINFLINIGYIVVITAILFLVLYIISNWLLPFTIAFMVAYLLNPIIDKFSKKTKMKKGFCAIFFVALVYIITLLLLGLIGYNAVTALINMFSDLPSIYANTIMPGIDRLINTFNNMLITIDPDIEMTVQSVTNEVFSNLTSQISSISVEAVSLLSGYIAKIPSFFLATLISIVASFFIAIDYDNIISFLVKKMSPKVKEIVLGVEEYSIIALKQYLKSYSIIIFITFVELSIGLTLLGVDNSILVAFLIAIFDIMPVLGTGGIIIPWGILHLILGNYPLGIGFLILYAIITTVRQVLEPKVVGDKVGLHPVATLMAMYLGIQIFGFLGLFLLPIAVVIIKQLLQSGKLKLFNAE